MAVCRAGAAAAKLPLYAYIAKLAGRKPEETTTLPVPFFSECPLPTAGSGGRLSTAPFAAVDCTPMHRHAARHPSPRLASFPLPPLPPADVLNAGEHSGAPLVFQEFMIAPVRTPASARCQCPGGMPASCCCTPASTPCPLLPMLSCEPAGGRDVLR